MAHKLKGKGDGEDVSVLRTPIQLHGKMVEQILNSVHYGTPELRGLLLDECDIIFECKVCRALFRDMANLIAHKRIYCSKSAAEDNYVAISRIPDEKVYVVQPQEPVSSTPPVVHVGKSRSKPSLDETIARIQSGELGHSHAFKVYSDAAEKLQRQKEEMKVATIRTRAIPTNPNAVFMDVNMASVNIHERSNAPMSSTSAFNSGVRCAHDTRKTKERMNANKNRSPRKRVRILRKDCKNSEELQKLLLKELKGIQIKAKQKCLKKDSVKQPLVTGQQTEVKKIISRRESALSSPTVTALEKDGHSSDTGLIAIDKRRTKVTPRKIEHVNKLEKLTPKVSNDTPLKVSNDIPSSKKKSKIAVETIVDAQETSKVCETPSPLRNIKHKLRKKSLICQKCNSIFSSKQTLDFHSKIIHSSKKTFFPCLYCPRVFYYFQGVTRHLEVNHSKSSSEIDSLREKLRAKAYSKVLLQEEDETNRKSRLTGLRQSSRHKQEAFSNETSPTSSYVLHSVKKMGKKLSAKKDAMSTPLPKEQIKETTSCENVKTMNSLSSPINDIRNIAVKKELESTSKKNVHNDASANSTINKKSGKKFRSSSLSPKSFALRQNIMHKCKKCRRKFGRMLTYKNHTKVCRGKIMASSSHTRGRPAKNFYVTVDQRSSASGKMETTPVCTKAIVNDSISPKWKISSNQTTRSSGKRSTRSGTSVKQEGHHFQHSNSCNRVRNRLFRQGDSASKSSHSSYRGRNTNTEHSLPNSGKKANLVKSEPLESESLDKLTANTESKSEEKTAMNLPHKDNLPLIPKSQNLSDAKDDAKDTSSSTGSVDFNLKIVLEKEFCLKPDIITNSSPQTHDADKTKDESSKMKEDEMDGGKTPTLTRSMRNIREPLSYTSDSQTSKMRSALNDVSKDRRSPIVEKDTRSRVSHLVPRASGEVSVAAKKDVSSSLVSVPSTSPIEERPRRKRKVPTRNIDAMEMLSKIHNPEKESLLCKKIEISSKKPPKRRPPLESKQASSVKSKMRKIRERNCSKDGERPTRRQEIKEGRLTKNRSRIFVVGRNKPRGRKLLRWYDNARVDKLIDLHNSKCLVCGEHCSHIYNLRRHIIRIHLQWSRYQCKLCRFASFDRSECTTHIVRNHRRAVNIEDSQAVNSCITDLTKQGSQVMNMKKNQTLRDKNKLQNREVNIYARPNVRKMPRLAERTLLQEKEDTESSSSRSPQVKQKLNNSASHEAHIKGVRHSARIENATPELSDNSSRRSSLTFNIPRRNSPQTPLKLPSKICATPNANAQGEVVMLHTRKGIYSKTIPAIPMKDKSDSTKMLAKGSSSVEMKDSKDDVVGKVSEVELHSISNCDLPKDQNIFDIMRLPSVISNHDSNTPSDESVSPEVSTKNNQFLIGVGEVQQGEQTVKSSSVQCDENNEVRSGKDKTAAIGEPPQSPEQSDQLLSVKLVSNGPSSATASSIDPGSKSLSNCKTVDKDIFRKMGDSIHPGTEVPSSSTKTSLCVSDPSNSSNTIRINPSYVVFKSARIPPIVHVSSGSPTKTLNVSQDSSKAADNNSAHSHSSTSDHFEENLSKTTLLDDDVGDGTISSTVSTLSELHVSLEVEQTQASTMDVQDV